MATLTAALTALAWVWVTAALAAGAQSPARSSSPPDNASAERSPADETLEAVTGLAEIKPGGYLGV